MMPLLARRDFRLLLIGQTVSALGDWMGTFALMYFVLDLSGSTTAVGGVLVLRLLPSAIGGPVAARIVSRWNRRQVMLTSDMIRTAMAIALPLLPLLAWVYSWAFAIEVVGLAFLPARDAAIPVLVGNGRDHEENETGTLALANGFTMGTSYGMIPIGAGAFGLILLAAQHAGWTGHWRYVVIFWLDAATYLISYLAVRRITGLESAGQAEKREQRQGARFLDALRLPLVRAVLPAIAVIALGLGSLFSIGVVFVREVLHAGPVGFGALIACFGVGAAVGLTALRRGRRDLLMQVRVGTAAQGIVIAFMGLIASLFWAFLGAVLFGAAATTALIGAITYLQEEHTGVERNLALTAFHSTLRFGLSVAALGGGVAADLVGTVHLLGLSLEPAQTILIGSGAVVFAGSLLVHDRSGQQAPARQQEPHCEKA
jgi:MFS family permease